MPGQIKIDDGAGNYTILTNAGSLGSDKTITIPNETATLATTNASNLGGLVKIDDHDFSTSTSITRDSVFSSTYNNYKIFINITDGSATTVQCALRLRASSTSTTSNYGGHRNYVSTGGTATHGSSFGTTYFYIGDTDSGSTDATCTEITLFAPNLAAPTKYIAHGQGFWSSSFYSQQIYAFQSDSTQFDGIEIYPFSPGGATITGNVQIFGIKQ
jgi:hypothetical protein